MSKTYNSIIRRRTIRLFKQKEVPLATVKKIINAARVAPSAANFQFIEYLVIRDKDLREKVFPHTKWAGYLYPRRIPPQGKRPVFYIFILVNKEKSTKPDLRDVGAAAENILLALSCFGLGGCWIASLNRGSLRKILNIPANYNIDSLIAAGYPDESPKLETSSKTVKYWLDKKGHLHVPKRPLQDILHYKF